MERISLRHRIFVRRGRMAKKMSFCYDILIRRQPFLMLILTKQIFELIFLASLYALLWVLLFFCPFFHRTNNNSSLFLDYRSYSGVVHFFNPFHLSNENFSNWQPANCGMSLCYKYKLGFWCGVVLLSFTSNSLSSRVEDRLTG